MQSISNPVPLLAVVGIVAGSWAAGAGASISLFTIPPILEAGTPRTVALRQWYLTYTRGKTGMPPLAAVIAGSYLWSARARAVAGFEWRGLAAAAALTLSIVPFTLIFIRASIGALEADMVRAQGENRGSEKKQQQQEQRSEDDEERTRSMLVHWSNLNLARSILPLIGVAAASWNIFFA
ncbi:hypothetical protein BX600DRAFT_134591 [Xylariales sp. PMI_506]|nr:hypothetical protein BX600DRAFT_134591 [Xylariales sp. PMI_506]